jgi:hypothetical protein
MDAAIATPVHTTVVGVFPDRAHAEAAIEHLRRAGFVDDQIGFIYQDPDAKVVNRLESDVEDGAGIGAAVGATAGGIAAIGVAAGLLTPIGPAVAGGALIAWLASVGVGAASGAVVGAMLGLGFSEADARWYESEVFAGRSLVTVHEAGNRSDDARSIIRNHGGEIREPSEVGSYGNGLPATPF